MDELLDSLPVMQRLALAYAPGRVREPTLALLALDNRLAGILRSASEPMLAQVRFAWWRDMLAREPQYRPAGEPSIAALDGWGSLGAELADLVDGWEELIGGEALNEAAARRFCAARGEAFATLAKVVGRSEASEAARRAGEGWALADLAARLDVPAERDMALGLVRIQDWSRIALPHELRPLAVLHGLAARTGRAGRGQGGPSFGALPTAMRIGLFGR